MPIMRGGSLLPVVVGLCVVLAILHGLTSSGGNVDTTLPTRSPGADGVRSTEKTLSSGVHAEGSNNRAADAICLRLKNDKVVLDREYDEVLLLRNVRSRVLNCTSRAAVAAGGSCKQSGTYLGVYFTNEGAAADEQPTAASIHRRKETMDVIRRCAVEPPILVLSEWWFGAPSGGFWDAMRRVFVRNFAKDGSRRTSAPPPFPATAGRPPIDRCDQYRLLNGAKHEKKVQTRDQNTTRSSPIIAMWFPKNVHWRHTYHSTFQPSGALQMILTAQEAERAILDNGWWKSSEVEGTMPLFENTNKSKNKRGWVNVTDGGGVGRGPVGLGVSSTRHIPFLPLPFFAGAVNYNSSFGDFVLRALFGGDFPQVVEASVDHEYCGVARWTVVGVLGQNAMTAFPAKAPITEPLQPPTARAFKTLRTLLRAQLDRELEAFQLSPDGRAAVAAVSTHVLYVPRKDKTLVWCQGDLRRIRGVSSGMRDKLMKLLVAHYLRRSGRSRADAEKEGSASKEGKLQLSATVSFDKLPVVLQYAAIKNADYVLAPDGATFVWLLCARRETIFVNYYRHFHDVNVGYAVNFFIPIANFAGVQMVIAEEKNLFPPLMQSVSLALSESVANVNAIDAKGPPERNASMAFRSFGAGFSLAGTTAQYVPAWKAGPLGAAAAWVNCKVNMP